MPLLVSWDYGNSQVMHDSFTIGNGNADLIIAEQYASAPHCLIRADGNSWVLEDLASTNGTYVNGTPGNPGREHGPYMLAKGDKIRIGRTVLTVVPF